jgi:hypothetical protein
MSESDTFTSAVETVGVAIDVDLPELRARAGDLGSVAVAARRIGMTIHERLAFLTPGDNGS